MNDAAGYSAREAVEQAHIGGAEAVQRFARGASGSPYTTSERTVTNDRNRS
ncbi:hypothetical protein [Massilia sp. HP4]|uniref:hypothetical protein n=1 Tax=Massilia sp. HP4 TaxID=2562316 RepID=UPI0019818BBE|nr:hypothetical protein [Massilia sp. HP4]